MSSRLTNAFVFASYAFLTAALTLALHRVVGMDPHSSVLIGAVALLISGQVHSLVGRMQERRELEQEIHALRHVTATMSRDLDQLHRRAEELDDAFTVQTRDRNEQIISEMRVLETLVKRLAEGGNGHVRASGRRASDRREPPPAGQERLPLTGASNPEFDEAELLDTIRSSLDSNRVDLYLQPIVTLPQRRVRFYEGLSRLRDPGGEVITPDEYMRVAEPAGMMPVVDNLLLFRCVQVVRRLVSRNREIGVFCNISAHSLLDSEFFPQFVEFMEHNRDLAGHLYFEFAQSAIANLGPIERASLDALRRLGFSFSLDQVRRLDMKLGELHDLGFHFIKLNADLLLGDMREAGGHLHAADMRQLFERHGIELIAERIEDERTVVALLDYDIAYGQGFLFGEPRPVREEAMMGAPGDLPRTGSD